jgi:hypothetical protein
MLKGGRYVPLSRVEIGEALVREADLGQLVHVKAGRTELRGQQTPRQVESA